MPILVKTILDLYLEADRWTSCYVIPIANAGKNQLHAEILIDVLHELDPDVRLLLFHDIKLQYHEAMRKGLKAHYADFEQHCFEFRERADIVVLETKCLRCDSYHLIDWPIMHYIKRSNLSPHIPLHGVPCTGCNQDNCIIVP